MPDKQEMPALDHLLELAEVLSCSDHLAPWFYSTLVKCKEAYNHSQRKRRGDFNVTWQ